LVATQTRVFLFTDIEDSAALVARLRGAPAGVLADYRLIRARPAAHGGKEVVTQGVGVVAVFASPRACAGAAAGVQRALVPSGWPAAARVRAWMGIDSGEASRPVAGLAGLGGYRAARVAAVAHGC
jgi:hypothetical protein